MGRASRRPPRRSLVGFCCRDEKQGKMWGCSLDGVPSPWAQAAIQE